MPPKHAHQGQHHGEHQGEHHGGHQKKEDLSPEDKKILEEAHHKQHDGQNKGHGEHEGHGDHEGHHGGGNSIAHKGAKKVGNIALGQGIRQGLNALGG